MMRRTKRRINKRPKKKVSRRRPIRRRMMRGGENCEDFLQSIENQEYETIEHFETFHEKLKSLHLSSRGGNVHLNRTLHKIDEFIQKLKKLHGEEKDESDDESYGFDNAEQIEAEIKREIEQIIVAIKTECSNEETATLEREKKHQGLWHRFKKQDIRNNNYSNSIPLYLPNYQKEKESYNKLHDYIKGKGIKIIGGQEYFVYDKLKYGFSDSPNRAVWQRADFIEGWTVDSKKLKPQVVVLTYKFKNHPMFQLECDVTDDINVKSFNRYQTSTYVTIRFMVLSHDMVPVKSIYTVESFLPNFDENDEAYKRMNKYIQGKGIELGDGFKSNEDVFDNYYYNESEERNVPSSKGHVWRKAYFIEGWKIKKETKELHNDIQLRVTYFYKNVKMFEVISNKKSELNGTKHTSKIHFTSYKDDMPK